MLKYSPQLQLRYSTANSIQDTARREQHQCVDSEDSGGDFDILSVHEPSEIIKKKVKQLDQETQVDLDTVERKRLDDTIKKLEAKIKEQTQQLEDTAKAKAQLNNTVFILLLL